MVSKTEFQDMVTHAYQALYDFVALRSHPLTQLLITGETDPKERGWQMHHMLLDTAEELYPGPDAPPFSREWRRHRLMVLRYVEAMEPQAVADQLAISRRQFYREHTAALEAIANVLWDRCIFDSTTEAGAEESAEEAATASAKDVMQMELARINQTDSYADLPEVVEGVLAILEAVFRQQAIDPVVHLPDDLPIVSTGHNLLRQTLLSILGYLVEHIADTTLELNGLTDNARVYLQITPQPAHPFDEEAISPQFTDFQAMLQLGNAQITLLRDDQQRPTGFELELPLEYDCTVLAVDDNEDTLALYKRCLSPNRYRTITTKTARSVVALAQETRPDIIILDLMMPDQDGWDLLQVLSNLPDTAHIPIMICSVLKQRQLALSLGAASFLEKPFNEQTLLAALHGLRTVYLAEDE